MPIVVGTEGLKKSGRKSYPTPRKMSLPSVTLIQPSLLFPSQSATTFAGPTSRAVLRFRTTTDWQWGAFVVCSSGWTSPHSRSTTALFKISCKRESYKSAHTSLHHASWTVTWFITYPTTAFCVQSHHQAEDSVRCVEQVQERRLKPQ